MLAKDHPSVDHIVKQNEYGSIVQIKDDIGDHYLQPDQRWIPQRQPTVGHPFLPGQMLTTKPTLPYRTYLMPRVVMVSRIRTFQYHRNQRPIHQIEVVSRPCQWYAAYHFSL